VFAMGQRPLACCSWDLGGGGATWQGLERHQQPENSGQTGVALSHSPLFHFESFLQRVLIYFSVWPLADMAMNEEVLAQAAMNVANKMEVSAAAASASPWMCAF
jgi:hypothetical protein